MSKGANDLDLQQHTNSPQPRPATLESWHDATQHWTAEYRKHVEARDTEAAKKAGLNLRTSVDMLLFYGTSALMFGGE